MEISKDIYEYLTNFADDEDILNMLSVNKKFRDEDFFERVMRRRYPNMINYKKDKESWKTFFIKTIYYISKLKEEYGIDHRFIKINPIYFYKENKKYRENIYNSALIFAQDNDQVDTEDLMEFVNSMISKGGDQDIALKIAIQRGRFDIAKKLLEKGASPDVATRAAIRSNNMKGLKFIFDEIGTLYKNEPLLSAAAFARLNLLIKNEEIDFLQAYEAARQYDQTMDFLNL